MISQILRSDMVPLCNIGSFFGFVQVQINIKFGRYSMVDNLSTSHLTNPALSHMME